MCVVLLASLLLPLASLPWATPDAYWSRFPAAWFGANATDWEDAAQIAEIGRYSMAILGWQALLDEDDWEAAVYVQLAQAGILKAAHPTLPVFVYCSFGWATGLNAAVAPLMAEGKPGGRYEDFFLQAKDGPEFSHTYCQQMHSSNPRCNAFFWKFSNSSARDYYVEHVVGPLALAPTIDGVFFDAVNYGYDIPEVHPWNRFVINVPGCTNEGGDGCEALLAGTLDVARRTTALLNEHGKVPMLANPAYYGNPRKSRIWLDESRLVAALANLTWITYYETARAEQIATGFNMEGPWMLSNMLHEGADRVMGGMHAYLQPGEDPTAHIAAFMLVREEGWYYFGSTGWFDPDWHWSALYDKKCGRPIERASSVANDVFVRGYEHCGVRLNCTAARVKGGACVGSITDYGA